MAAPFLRSSSRPAGRLMARNSNARVPVRRLPDPQRRGERNLGYLASASTRPARRETPRRGPDLGFPQQLTEADNRAQRDRKSTRLNSSHVAISYAVFCLKKK